ncbi:MBOAT family O-acyltransferase [Allocoleopsis sp.]|uniref:MBOAT family O-acyltransferase n=1 Tax=Allocoleopsis sp. TaxID=3088169 RepID=UPI002FD2AAED
MACVQSNKKLGWALRGIFFNLLLLVFFKYGSLLAGFVGEALNWPFSSKENNIVLFLLHLPLPLGISFYTFEGISLIVDVLRSKDNQKGALVIDVDQKFNTHLVKSSLFIAFFPHLIAGPILKANNFYPQIQPKYFSHISWNIVFRSLVVGYFLKMVIADNLKDYTFWIAHPYYQLLSTSTGLVLLFGYSIQIFADFAGYSLIAIGTAAAFGYHLPDNFNFPYISRSVSEFWKRWHISLSTWLKDYLYIPLGGNRRGKVRTYINLMIVMILGGLWHGASLSYAVWGSYHGFGLVIERFFKNRINANFNQSRNIKQQFIFDAISMILVFCFVSLGWLLFKLPNFGQVLEFLKIMIINVGLPSNRTLTDPVIILSLPVVVYHLIHLPAFQKWKDNLFFEKSSSRVGNLCEDIILGGMIAMLFLNSGSSNEFIYFQF